jgi:hypothetical protein
MLDRCVVNIIPVTISTTSTTQWIIVSGIEYQRKQRIMRIGSVRYCWLSIRNGRDVLFAVM